MSKIELDKYYTENSLAKYCINKTKEIIGEQNIIEYLEPSAGGGVFLNYLDKPYLAYDIEPDDNRIIKQDYLELELEYKKGRCIIGNPPYLNKKTLIFEQFYNKSIELGDYIAFILPISQLNNSVKLYKFDLVYSENLGMRHYTDRDLLCCFNIYKRPKDKLNSKPSFKLQDVDIINVMNKNGKVNKLIDIDDFDISICNRGNGTIGKILTESGIYNSELHIKIHNNNLREKVIELIKNTNFKKLCPSISSKYIPAWRLYKYIKEQIPEIK